LKRIHAADLFCGAGGTSTGLLQACARLDRRVELTAVNHWQLAVETHAKNHPRARHACEDLATMDPRKAIPGGKLDLLVASPECTHHSVARGGKPVNDQSRASAWCILRWATALHIDRILIENVREFTSWGPIGSNGRPLKSRRGETFQTFLEALRSLGYRVDWRVLNAADFGDATTRERLFVQAVRGRRQIRWPEPTHGKDQRPALFGDRLPWKPAREVIDWRMRGLSIFGRKRPLSENTLKRIEAGLRKFGGTNAVPFLLLLRGTDRYTRSIEQPVPTITAGGGHVALCEPFLMSCTHQGGDRVQSVDRPVPTITTAKRGEQALIQPFIVNAANQGGEDRRCHSLDDPLPTITTIKRHALATPFLVSAGGPNVDARPVSEPMNTVLTRDHMGLVEPFLVPYYGACTEADSISDPIRTVTTKDRLGLVEPNGHAQLDILFRMLQPHELAAAMSFPANYQFAGNRGDQRDRPCSRHRRDDAARWRRVRREDRHRLPRDAGRNHPLFQVRNWRQDRGAEGRQADASATAVCGLNHPAGIRRNGLEHRLLSGSSQRQRRGNARPCRAHQPERRRVPEAMPFPNGEGH